MSLPPGQRAIGSFPRFGIALWERPPAITQPAHLRVAGAVAHELDVPVSRLVGLPRCDVASDFHCVTGWTVRGLQWGGVSFRTFYETVIVPEASPAPDVSYIRFEGADGFRATLTLDDALEDRVLLADRLGGSPLNIDHGGPLRLLSPKQYGYKSAKHLCRIELHTREPADGYRGGVRRVLALVVRAHPRARVAQEERHRYLPAWAVRTPYRGLIRPWLWAFGRRSTR